MSKGLAPQYRFGHDMVGTAGFQPVVRSYPNSSRPQHIFRLTKQIVKRSIFELRETEKTLCGEASNWVKHSWVYKLTAEKVAIEIDVN